MPRDPHSVSPKKFLRAVAATPFGEAEASLANTLVMDDCTGAASRA